VPVKIIAPLVLQGKGMNLFQILYGLPLPKIYSRRSTARPAITNNDAGNHASSGADFVWSACTTLRKIFYRL